MENKETGKRTEPNNVQDCDNAAQQQAAAIKLVGVGARGGDVARLFAGMNKPGVAVVTVSADNPGAIDGLWADTDRLAIVVAGMGGGTDCAVASAVAQSASGRDITTLGFAMMPAAQGAGMAERARTDAGELRQHVTSIMQLESDDAAAAAVASLAHVAVDEGLINLDLNDICTTLRGGGLCYVGSAEAEGEQCVARSVELAAAGGGDVQKRSSLIMAHLDVSPDSDLKVGDFLELLSFLEQASQADVIWGWGYDASLGNRVRATLIAAGM